MIRGWLLLLALLMAAASSAADHPEVRPFMETADASSDIAVAMASAAKAGKSVIVVMGANWCHDSRALAGWFATPHFAEMLRRRYKIVYVDAGTPQTGKGRNLDIAKRFGFRKLKNTPLVMIVSAEGRLLNSRKDAVSWRNAASRSEDDIYRYFDGFTPA